jgi:hypothetical protein
MGPDAAPDRWAAVLDAVAASPVRSSVKPAGLPSEAGDDLLKTARQAAGRVPALAALLGIEPKPSGARPPRRPGQPPPPPRRPIPPPPSPPAADAPAHAAAEPEPQPAQPEPQPEPESA